MSHQMYRLERMKALKNSRGIQYLLNVGYEIMGNPIYIHDMDGKLLAHTQNVVTDDPVWNEMLTQGFYSEKSVAFFKEECFIDAIANTKTTAFLNSDQLKYDRICGRILCENNLTIAFADMVACNKPFTDDDPILLEVLCRKAARELSKAGLDQEYGEACQEAMIKELIAGGIEDKRLYTPSVAEIYDGFENYLYIGIAAIAKLDSQPAYVKNRFKQTQPKFKYAVYDDQVVIIFSSDEEKLDAREKWKKFKRLMEENDICVGVSCRFENLFALRKHYLEALQALYYGLDTATGQRIFLHDEIPADLIAGRL